MKENTLKQTSTYIPYNRNRIAEKPPGKPVGVVAVLPSSQPKVRFNPFIIYLTVSPYRKDFNKVVDQVRKLKKVKLPSYEQSLFYSCFKNWS
jgi:hypothetical protein